jgi:hypothetical protein
LDCFLVSLVHDFSFKVVKIGRQGFLSDLERDSTALPKE